MIYVLYDKPKKLEDMSFLTAAFEKEYKEIYPEWRCTSIKQMLSVCSTTVKRTKSGDTIVCWYDFMGVLCWWLSKLTNAVFLLCILPCFHLRERPLERH